MDGQLNLDRMYQSLAEMLDICYQTNIFTTLSLQKSMGLGNKDYLDFLLEKCKVVIEDYDLLLLQVDLAQNVKSCVSLNRFSLLDCKRLVEKHYNDGFNDDKCVLHYAQFLEKTLREQKDEIQWELQKIGFTLDKETFSQTEKAITRCLANLCLDSHGIIADDLQKVIHEIYQERAARRQLEIEQRLMTVAWREFIKEQNLDVPYLPPLKNATLCRAIKEVLDFPSSI